MTNVCLVAAAILLLGCGSGPEKTPEAPEPAPTVENVVEEARAKRTALGAYRATYRVQGLTRMRTITVSHVPPHSYRMEFDGGCIVISTLKQTLVPKDGFETCAPDADYRRIPAGPQVEALYRLHNAIADAVYGPDKGPSRMHLESYASVLGKFQFGISHTTDSLVPFWKTFFDDVDKLVIEKKAAFVRLKGKGHEVDIDRKTGLAVRWTMNAGAKRINDAIKDKTDVIHVGRLTSFEPRTKLDAGLFELPKAKVKYIDSPESVADSYVAMLTRLVLAEYRKDLGEGLWPALGPEKRKLRRNALAPLLDDVFQATYGFAITYALDRAAATGDFCADLGKTTPDPDTDTEMVRQGVEAIRTQWLAVFDERIIKPLELKPEAGWYEDIISDLRAAFERGLTARSETDLKQAMARCRNPVGVGH